jgi:hypothetical protein
MHGPEQQSTSVLHVPPIGAHVRPDGTHVPRWQTPPVQQSESAVHVFPPSAMHALAHTSWPAAFGAQMLLQQLSQSAQVWPAG